MTSIFSSYQQSQLAEFESQFSSNSTAFIKLTEVKFNFTTPVSPTADVLGSGGFGIIRKATFKGDVVAVKFLKFEEKQDFSQALRSIKLFVSEAQKMRAVRHPCIVEFKGFILESFAIVMGKYLWYYLFNNLRTYTSTTPSFSSTSSPPTHLLEFMPDGTLYECIKSHRNSNTLMAWSDRFWCALDVANGMRFLHSKRLLNGQLKDEIFHQDLKTPNVLLLRQAGSRLTAKVSDFGLSGK